MDHSVWCIDVDHSLNVLSMSPPCHPPTPLHPPPPTSSLQVLVWHTRTQKPLVNEQYKKDTIDIEVWVHDGRTGSTRLKGGTGTERTFILTNPTCFWRSHDGDDSEELLPRRRTEPDEKLGRLLSSGYGAYMEEKQKYKWQREKLNMWLNRKISHEPIVNINFRAFLSFFFFSPWPSAL